MAKTVKPVVRARRAKAEVEQEFTQVRQEVEAARETVDAKAEETAAVRAAEVRQAVDEVAVEGVVGRISGLGLEISKALAEVSEKLVEEVRNLATIREAVALERQELERLHKIDVAATAIDQMVQDYARQKGLFEANMAAQRDAWAEEARNVERERKEAEEALKKQRQREIDEYEYKKALERKKAQDKYDEEMRLQDKANREKQETLEKRWQEREAGLKQQEQELNRLRKEAEEFPARLEREAKQAAAAASRAVQAQFEQQTAFLKKDAEDQGPGGSGGAAGGAGGGARKTGGGGQTAGAGYRREGDRGRFRSPRALAHQRDRHRTGQASVAAGVTVIRP